MGFRSDACREQLPLVGAERGPGGEVRLPVPFPLRLERRALLCRFGVVLCVVFLLGGEAVASQSRTPEILADAAYAIFNRSSREATGNFYIDEEVLRAEGVTDFDQYAPGAKGPLAGDFFVPDEVFARSPTKVMRPWG